jgi:hypothetical protein
MFSIEGGVLCMDSGPWGRERIPPRYLRISPARGGTIIVDFVGGRVRIFVPQRIATQLEIENLVLPYRSTVI